ncbi:MAG: hypothetical protein AB1414_13885 [bacterium]
MNRIFNKQNGIGIIELVISFAVLIIGILGILFLQLQFAKSKIMTETKNEARQIAIERLEWILTQPYERITTTGTYTINIPPLFGTVTTREKKPYLPEVTVTDHNDIYDDYATPTTTSDYKEIVVSVTYPKEGIDMQSSLGSISLTRCLYNNSGTISVRTH